MSQGRQQDWPSLLRRLAATGEPAALGDIYSLLREMTSRDETAKRQANSLLALLESYQAGGRVNDSIYRDVTTAIGKNHEMRLSVEAFRIHDRIASDPENFTLQDVEAGLEVATQLDDDGLLAYFSSLAAQFAYSQGQIRQAKNFVIGAINKLVALVEQDPVYASGLAKASVNGTSFSVLDGDFDTARTCFGIANALGVGDVLESFSSALSSPVPTERNGAKAAELGSDFLEAGDAVRALEWLTHADRILTNAHDEKRLCEMLGDLAVAYRRAGNVQAAVETNRRAIQLCRVHRDDLNLARWSGNLGHLLLQGDDMEGAHAAFEEALAAAQRTGRADQIGIAKGNIGITLAGMGRHAEAIEQMDRAVESAADNSSVIGSVSRHNKLVVYAKEALEALMLNQLGRASDAIAGGLAIVDWGDREDKAIAGDLLTHRAIIEEARSDLKSAVATLDDAAEIFDELGDRKRAQDLRTKCARLPL